jgi:hypothetical protein
MAELSRKASAIDLNHFARSEIASGAGGALVHFRGAQRGLREPLSFICFKANKKVASRAPRDLSESIYAVPVRLWRRTSTYK